MKVAILAGGVGSRLSEETVLKPKPMVEIGGKPILWHILNIYAAHGFNEFVVALGYKGESIKDYFLNFYALNNDVTVDLASGEARIHRGGGPSWKVHLVDTGASMIAALHAVRAKKPAILVCAIPVAAPDSAEQVRPYADEFVCLETPLDFMAVGQFYSSFQQVEDDEVVKILARHAMKRPAAVQ